MALKNIYFLIILLGSINLGFSNNLPDSDAVQKFKKMGLVWGLLKYHHPDISDGQYDWDGEFIKFYDKIEKLDRAEKVDSVLLEFVMRFDTKAIRIDDVKDPKLFMKNYDYQWIENLIGNAKLKGLLNRLKDNKNISDYYTHVNSMGFIDFPNESKMSNFDLTKASHRLLLLFKFWNVIQYWYANKSLITNNWEGVLDKYLPGFLDCENNFEFELLKSKLSSELKDSHTFFYSKTLIDSLFEFKPNFWVTNVNDSLVVSYLINQKKCESDDIKLGDVITEVEGNSIKDALHKRLSSLISVSNRNFLGQYSSYLMHSSKNKIDVALIRNGELLQRKINLSTEIIPDSIYTKEGKHSAIEKLRKDVFYLDLSQLTKKACDSFFKVNEHNIENLVIDLRQNNHQNLGLSDVCDYLVNKKKKFIKVLTAINNAPSKFEINERSGGLVGTFIDAFTIGKRSNKNYVKGKIILIVNGRTQSEGEYFGMAIQQAPNCITIGQQTAGSPMNITIFELPDGTKSQFTSMTGYYPNSDLPVHQNGLKIDYYVPLSTDDYHSDQYIDFALKTLDEQ